MVRHVTAIYGGSGGADIHDGRGGASCSFRGRGGLRTHLHLAKRELRSGFRGQSLGMVQPVLQNSSSGLKQVETRLGNMSNRQPLKHGK